MSNIKIGVIGLGYIGLPLAIELGRFYEVVGFDINKERIHKLIRGIDTTKELTIKKILSSKKISFSINISDLKNCNIYMIAVPTPIFKNKLPDLRLLKKSIKLICKYIDKNNIIILESTVYPGVTEEFCVPLIEKYTKLKLNKDFYMGYCPERINPGDKLNNIQNVNKIISGSTKATTNKIKKIYNKIIKAKVFATSSIKVAEAAKIIENSQRDINIAFMNEISMIFNKLNIDTNEVIKAASTKWNFLDFKPGLVGGHCISVDPYYLAYVAEKNNKNAVMIKTARKINDHIPNYIVKNLEKNLKKFKIAKQKINILIMGATFKENCSDIRDSKSIEIVKLLNKQKYNTEVYDPYLKKNNSIKNINIISKPKVNFYHGILITVKHNYFLKIGLKKIKNFGTNDSLLYDIKSLFDKNLSDFKL